MKAKKIEPTTHNEPPLLLVKTWVQLLRSNESELVRGNAKEKLLNAFGSLEELAQYMRENGLN